MTIKYIPHICKKCGGNLFTNTLTQENNFRYKENKKKTEFYYECKKCGDKK